MASENSQSAVITLTLSAPGSGAYSTTLPRDCAQYSSMIANLIADIQCGEGDPVEIPLPDISSPLLLDQLVAFLQDYHRYVKELPMAEVKQLAEDRYRSLVDQPIEWAKRYLQIDPPQLLAQLLAADYLGIDSLYKMTARKICKTAVPKDTVEEIQQAFGIAPVPTASAVLAVPAAPPSTTSG